MRPPLHVAFFVLVLGAGAAWSQEPAREKPFRITVVDEATGRGVPLVELETVNGILWVTDSAGVAAIDEPGLLGQEVFFHVRSHGYEFPADGFGYRGIRPKLVPGGACTAKLKRINVAERLYRVTGEGIYRDSVLLGDRPPVRQPVLNGGVLGQDSVVTGVYRGRIHWFWGDTNRAGYPLGQFATSGAVSDPPGKGGLDPSVGVDLTYYVDATGFSRKMCPIEGPGPVWIDGLMVLEEGGREIMTTHYSRMKNLGERLEHGMAMWDDAQETFVKRVAFPQDAPIEPHGHPFRVASGDAPDWFYFADPFPAVRVRARLADIFDPSKYEAFTCLKHGAHWDEKSPALDRDAAGRLAWGWKADTAATTVERQQKLIQSKAIAAREGWHALTDVETGKPVQAHGGSVAWNAHRGCWVMIFLETWGRSMLGEVWYAEGDTPLGPWVYARRVVTHEQYSFYNVKHHPYFDADGGRYVFFEGTYVTTFSGNPVRTPRYDYNQVMYRLDLDDPRVRLPAPVYGWSDRSGAMRYATRAGVPAEALVAATVEFYALPPERATTGSVPVPPAAPAAGVADGPDARKPLFFILPADATPAANPALTDLFEYRLSGAVRYATDEYAPGKGWTRSDAPLGRVWHSPRPDPPREPEARPGG